MCTAAAPSAVTPFIAIYTLFIIFVDTLLILYLLIAIYIVLYLLLLQIICIIPFCLYTLNFYYM